MRTSTVPSRRASRAAGAIALALTLVATSCGSRLSDEDRALAATGGGSPSQLTGPRVAAGPEEDVEFEGSDEIVEYDEITEVATAGDGGNGTGGPGGDDGDAGAGGGPTGTGAAGGNGPGAGAGDAAEGGAAGGGPGQTEACRPSGSSAPGVSGDEIRVGNVSTMSGPIPGFAQTGVGGVRAYFNMVNAQGGVCGRKLTLVTADDRLQAAANRSETEKLADQVLAFVGNTTVTDDGGTPVIESKQVPDVSLSVSEARIRSPYNFSPSPIDLDGGGAGAAKILAHMKQTYGVATAAIMYPEQASAKNRALEYRDDFAAAGIEVVEEFSVAVTETNFTSQVNRMKSQDVDIVITTLEVNGMARLAQAFEQANWFPKVPFYGAQVYGQKFIELAGRAAEGTTVGMGYSIAEDRSTNPAVAALHEWYSRSNPGLDLDFFAVMGWVAADMFVTALRATGPDPTRDALLAELRKLSPYDGGELVGRIDPVNKKPAQCFMVATVEGGQWKRVSPGQGFQC